MPVAKQTPSDKANQFINAFVFMGNRIGPALPPGQADVKDSAPGAIKCVGQPSASERKAAEDCAHSKTWRNAERAGQRDSVLECAQSSAAFLRNLWGARRF